MPWHNHENEDELFYIANGTLFMEIENQPDLILKKGDLFVENKGRKSQSFLRRGMLYYAY